MQCSGAHSITCTSHHRGLCAAAFPLPPSLPLALKLKAVFCGATEAEVGYDACKCIMSEGRMDGWVGRWKKGCVAPKKTSLWAALD